MDPVDGPILASLLGNYDLFDKPLGTYQVNPELICSNVLCSVLDVLVSPDRDIKAA